MDDATIQAFVETEYRVDSDPPLTLRIGVRSEGLFALQNARGVACSAFITACNPASIQVAPAGNDQAQAALKAALQSAAVQFIEGVGQHPHSSWPGEQSVLALGLSRETAEELGRQFGQDAIVWCGRDAVPQLVLLR